MPTPRNGSSPARRKKIETPVLAATLVCLVLAGVGAVAGFEVLGGLGPVPVLIVLIVLVFAVGAVMTVRRITALRSPAPGPSKD
ncbi:hypothetical protein [Isoptericola cucumis]|uniref:Uncharacterized protein n=1 Tax=Isoptericola cucumis TaxID=1776856 RepID=A0ABQ2BA49_9MICO|nr:hypothetical protein [Isoptericola cucumis]GGI11413.1 hypothetical protein GCM10007368_36070 [Isoptericola cucumis]